MLLRRKSIDEKDAFFADRESCRLPLTHIMDGAKSSVLAETAEEMILRDGESEELLLFLARECLNENSTWYAYQSKNKPDMVI